MSSKELKKEAISYGLNVEGKSVAQIEQLIAEYLWSKNNPNVPIPEQISPMLLNDITFKGKEYIDSTFKPGKYCLQHKLNGQRMIMQVSSNSLYLSSRSRSVKTHMFTNLTGQVLGLLNIKFPFEKTILDGELIMENPNIILPSGVHTESTLQSTVGLTHLNTEQSIEMQKKYGSLTYKVFDCIKFHGKDVQSLPYSQRIKLTFDAVKEIISNNPDASIKYVPIITTWKSAWDSFQEYVKQGGEGLIVKELAAHYEQGKRTKHQYKLKGFSDVDAFVTGFVKSSDDKGYSNYIGGLVFSSYVDGKLREVAAVSNIDLNLRAQATIIKDGNPTLNPAFLNRCCSLIGQDFNKKSMRLNSARINEWRNDKTPEECKIDTKFIKFNTAI